MLNSNIPFIKNINYEYNSLIIFIMIILPFLSSTTFNNFQIVLELLLWILLIFGFIRQKKKTEYYFLIILLIISYTIALFFIELHYTLLNFKIFGLFIFTYIYFENINYFPKKLMYFFLFLNIAYAFCAKIFNFWFIESLPFFVKKDVFLYSRPVGFLGSPHATSTFLCLFLLYLIQVNKNFLLQFAILISLFLYSSWTAVLALFVNISYIYLKKYIRIKVNPILFLTVILLISFFSLELILIYFKDIEGSRFYSLEIMSNMLFDINYYKGIFSFIPQSHDLFIMKQEQTFADVGNELGIVKIIIEGGILLSTVSLFLIFTKLNNFNLFFIITLFHYSFFINMPFIFYFAIMINKEINQKYKFLKLN